MGIHSRQNQINSSIHIHRITGIQIRGEKQGMHSKQRTWRRGAGEGPDLGAAGSRRGRGGGAAASRRGRGGRPGQASRRGRGEQGDRRVELPSGAPSQEERTSGSGRAAICDLEGKNRAGADLFPLLLPARILSRARRHKRARASAAAKNFARERVVRLRAALRACAPRNRRRGADLRRLVAAPA